jgi:hypothetical protein
MIDQSEPSERTPVRRVVCAAMRSPDGDILVGIRHYSQDMHAQLKHRDDAVKFHHLGGSNQGFVDQHGLYLTREEAYIVASRAGQIINHQACRPGPQGSRLYSEALY